MRDFLQFLDEKVWQAVKIGWTKPTEALAGWDDAMTKVANFNSRELNALFNAVTNEEFKKISSTKITKEVWTILQTTYEGTKVVKDSKLQRLTQYLVSHGLTRGKADQILFIKKEDDELRVAQVYVDDIIFGSTKDELAHSFSKLMHAEFEMSMIGKLTHFLGL